MKTLQGKYRIGDLCKAFEVSRSGYHRWRAAGPGVRAREDARIGEMLREIHQKSRDTYGRPRLTAALRSRGVHCSQKRVGRLMRTLGLHGVRRGKFRPQTTQSADRTPAPNLLLHRGGAAKPGQVWVADITFVPTTEGWLYVAGIMDQGSRRIHHSDQGYQYSSTNYRRLLRQKRIAQSMSRKANCYDNAHMESFWATMKTECLAAILPSTRAQVQLAIFNYIHTFYNRVRLHSALGFHSPVDFESINT